MNFNQEPGMYDEKTDELIMNWNDLNALDFAKVYSHEDFSILCNMFYKPENTYYIILPKSINEINKSCFHHDKLLTSIYGEGIKKVHEFNFIYCDNLEKVKFPNIEYIGYMSFNRCPRLEEKYKHDGLYILNDKYLIEAIDYDKEKLVIPKNVKVVAPSSSRYNKKIKEVIFPPIMDSFSYNCFKESEISKITLPCKFKQFYLSEGNPDRPLTIIYKGDEKLLQKTIEECKLFEYVDLTNVLDCDFRKRIKYEQIDGHYLTDTNLSLMEIENIVNKRLTLDEILNLNYSMKEANDYFKETER